MKSLVFKCSFPGYDCVRDPCYNLPLIVQGPRIVHLRGYSAGTIIVKTSQRRLYYVVGGDAAIRYPVGVGKAGMAWSGTAYIQGKYIRPAWSPPEMIKRENPKIPNVIPGGSSANPMGAAAMILSGGGEYAIHGTNNPESIGGFVSHGCIRMHNATSWTFMNVSIWEQKLLSCPNGLLAQGRKKKAPHNLIAADFRRDPCELAPPALAYWQFVAKGPSGERQPSPLF